MPQPAPCTWDWALGCCSLGLLETLGGCGVGGMGLLSSSPRHRLLGKTTRTFLNLHLEKDKSKEEERGHSGTLTGGDPWEHGPAQLLWGAQERPAAALPGSTRSPSHPRGGTLPNWLWVGGQAGTEACGLPGFRSSEPHSHTAWLPRPLCLAPYAGFSGAAPLRLGGMSLRLLSAVVGRSLLSP